MRTAPRSRIARIVAPVESLEPRRLMAAGDLDPSFGTGGKVSTDIGLYTDRAEGVALAADGGILIGGTTGSFLLAKYLPDGSFDPAFGAGGKVSVANVSGPVGIAVQPDGHILAVGTTSVQSKSVGVVRRFTPAGQLDTTWDTDGARTFDVAGSSRTNLYAMAVQPDGKVVAVGSVTYSGGRGEWVVVRFNANGSPDATFSGDGWCAITFPDNGNVHTARSVAIQPDGKIVIAGSVTGSPTGVFSTGMGVARLTSEGELDATFDGDGRAALAFAPFGASNSSTSGEEVEVLPGGKILVAGARASRAAVYRLHNDGSVDLAFGGGDGVYDHPANATVSFPRVHDLAVFPDGHIVLAGATSSSIGGDMVALMLTEDGTPESDFGLGGFATADFGEGAWANGVAIQPDGKVVLAGQVYTGADRVDIGLARFEGLPQSPAITGAYLSGDNWSASFLQFLHDRALGTPLLGYALPVEGATPRTIPWINVNRLSLTFSGSPGVARGDLSVRGADGSSYEFLPLGFRYNALTRTATWVFDGPLPTDRLQIDWAGSGPGADLRFDVLPGDADGMTGRVNAADQGFVKARLNRAAAEGAASAEFPPYSAYADVNADGRINAADQGAVKARLNDALPGVSAQGGAPLRREGVAGELFGESAILD